MATLVNSIAAVVVTSALAGAANTVPNGDFENAGLDQPVGWERVGGPAEQLIYASDGPQQGEHFVKLDTRKINERMRCAWHLKESIPVEPGATYRLEFYFRIDFSNLSGGQAVYTQGRYLATDRKELPWRQVGRVTLNTGGWARKSYGWRFRQVSFVVPAEAAFLDLSIAPAAPFRGVVAVDSVRITKIDKAVLDALPPDAVAFDFMPPSAESTPGFQSASAGMGYTKQRGYGWDLSKRQTIRTVHNDNGYPDRLDSTGVSRATFLCDLPNGPYRASLFTGGVWRTSVDEMNRLVAVGGRDVVNDQRSYNQLMDEEYFRYVSATLVTPDDLARPGYAVWDRYLARRYRCYDFTFQVRDGQLRLEIQQGYANGLIVFPERLKKQYRQIVDEYERARQREFVETWAELIPESVESTNFRPDAIDSKRGYVLFQRHWMRRVHYASRPQTGETDPTLQVFATPGEYEPTTFSIWPLHDLGDVQIKLSPLKNEAGDVLPPETFRVWYCQYRQERRSTPCTAYTINPAYLPDWNVRELFKDLTTRCWLNAKVSENARPGLYRGTVQVRPEHGQAATIPIELRVFGFKLIRQEALHTFRRAGTAVTVPYPSSYPFEPADRRNKQYYRAEAIRDLYEHGFTPEYAAWWHGIWRRDGKRLIVDWDQDNSLAGRPSETLRMIRDLAPQVPKSIWVDACAIGHRYIIPAFRGEPADGITVGQIDQWLDALEHTIPPLGFQRIYLAPWGEESHFPPGKGFEQFIAFHRHVRQNRDRWPHIRTAHTCNTDWGQEQVIREVDLAALGMFHGARSDASEQVAMARQTGRPFGLYGIRGRWVVGFYFWRAGASATYHEFYAPYWGTPNNDWDNPTGMDRSANKVMNEAPGWCNATYSPDGRMIDTWFWEEMREGVDDHDYLNTLETFIARAAGRSESPVVSARQEAQRVLQAVTDAVKLPIDPLRMRGLVYRPVSEEEHDRLRRSLALAAERLHAACQSFEQSNAE